MLGGVGVDGFHHLARLIGERHLRLLDGCGGGHDVFSSTTWLDGRCGLRAIKPKALK